MSQKVIKITGWVLTIVLALFFVMTGTLKLIGNETVIAQTASIGVDPETTRILGIIEIFSVILFIIPRTGVAGTLLLVAYMGGVIATGVQHQQPIAMGMVTEALVWITAVLRFPELGQRLFFGK